MHLDIAKRMADATRFQIAQYWAGQGIGFVPDLDWPTCFACGYDYLKTHQPASRRAAWDSSKLERAHVVAASIGGGSKDPSNFVLLCKRCHHDAPMSNRPEILFDWMLHREDWVVWQLRELTYEAEQSGYMFSEDWEPREFITFLKGIQTDFHCHALGSRMRIALLVPHLKLFARLVEQGG